MAEKTNVPEIRFAGFADPWEQRKLGELLLFQNGFNGSSESFGSGIPLISVMDVLDDEFITHETVRGKARLNCEEASRYCVEYGDVLFQRSSENQEDAGTSNVYLDQHVSSAFGGFVIRGKKVGEYNPIFIKYLLGSSFIREQITHRAQGAQHINVSQDTLVDVVLLMPSMREQEAVGLVFLHLDSLITLHQCTCPIFYFCAHGSRANFASTPQGQLRVLRYPRPIPKMLVSPSSPVSGVFDTIEGARGCGSSSAIASTPSPSARKNPITSPSLCCRDSLRSP